MKNTKSYIGWCYRILWDKYSVLLKGTLERGIGKGLPPMDSKTLVGSMNNPHPLKE
jgi:hypothetical protein